MGSRFSSTIRNTLLLVFVSALAGRATGADRPPPFEPALIEKLFAAPLEPELDSKIGLPRQLLTIAGREDLVWKGRQRMFRPACKPLVSEEKPVDPLPTILERAKDARLVLINEGHDDPQSRSFIIDLLEPLRREGFTHYAAETFYDDIQPLTPPWPRLSDGYYSREPIFGELLRRARRLQYVFVPYEKMEPARPGQPWQDRLAARETAQAQNLIRRVLNKPGTRALVHAGYSHVSEEAVTERDGTTVSWMAKRLKSETGIDPLTIDQTRFVSPIDRPVLCALHDPAEQEQALPTDLTIGLPPVTFRDGRPAWRQARGHKPAAIPAEFSRAHAWLIVEARYAGEPDQAVPTDRLLIGPDEKLPLLLPPGEYRIEAWSREEGWSRPVPLTVDH